MNEVRNSTTSNTNTEEESVSININELIESEEAVDHEAVSVYRVPRCLSSAKPEAYTPQFVGLGPYHHNRTHVCSIDKLKVRIAKKILKLKDSSNYTKELERSKLAAAIRECYDTSIAFKDDNLLSLMTVDALFLYQLLQCLEIKEQGADDDIGAQLKQNISILIGKQNIPLVNAGGIELTMDVIISDIFMLENQIPVCILGRIMSQVPRIELHHVSLDSAMLDFCKAVCPLPPPDKSIAAEPAHLLDLMYHLIVPDPEPPSEPDPEPESGKRATGEKIIQWLWIFRFVLAYVSLLNYAALHSVVLILKLLFWVLSAVLGPVGKLVSLFSPWVEKFDKFQTNRKRKFLKPIAVLVGQAGGASMVVNVITNSFMNVPRAVTIPTVTELHNAGIQFKPAQGGISSIKFDDTEKECQFYLPSIRLDVNSEVIIRNLVAYESLTKSNYLIFTGYIELMKAIVATAEDVKLLVEVNVIQTELCHDVVAQLFCGMSKSIRPTKTQKLDREIEKVNQKFDRHEKLYRVLTEFVDTLGKFYAFYIVLAILAVWAVTQYCSVYSCRLTSSNVAQGRDCGRKDHFISSM